MIIVVDMNVITNFIIISILDIIAELTELHKLAVIVSFLFFLIVEVRTGKLK